MLDLIFPGFFLTFSVLSIMCPWLMVPAFCKPKKPSNQKAAKAKKPEIAKATSAKKAQTIKGQEPKSQEGKAAKAQKKNTSQQPQTSEQRKCPLMIFHDITLFLYPFDDHLIPLSKFDDPMISQCSQLHFHHLSQFHRQLRLGAEGAELQFCLETREPPFHQPRNVR
jgi:hypothetical protein